MMGHRLVLFWLAGMMLAGLLAAAGIAYGATPLPLPAVLHALAGSVVPRLDDGVPEAVRRIVLDLRLPRVLLAVCVGAGLAVVGTLLQAVTRNDLADPFLFGLSSGAAAGAVSVITIFGDRLGVWTLSIAAFIGAMLAALILLGLLLARRGQGPERLVIAGLAVSFMFSALTTYLVFAGDQRAASSVLFWSAGGLGLAQWQSLPLAFAGTLIAVMTGLWCSRQLDALLTGEAIAASLGINVIRLRMVVFALSALATASLVALSGVIGFVGLMAPHLARGLVGVQHRRLIGTAALLGALMLLAGDLVSRVVVAPQELPVGIVTAAAGSVFVLVMVLRRP